MIRMAMRAGIFGAGALGGIYVANKTMPVDAKAAAVGALDSLTSGLGALAGGVKSGLESQIQRNIIVGVLGGVVLAAIVDSMI